MSVASVASVASTAAVAAPSIAPLPAPTSVYDPQADYQRALEAVEVLRSRRICNGWQIDEAWAARALDVFRRAAAGEFDDTEAMSDEEFDAYNFFGHHGVSLDWLCRGDRKALIVGCAAGSDRALECRRGQAASDPILTAIEAHRAAVRAHDEAVSRESAAEIAANPKIKPARQLIDQWEVRVESALKSDEDGNANNLVREVIAEIRERASEHISENAILRIAAYELARGEKPELFVRMDREPSPESVAARQRTSEASDAEDDAAIGLLRIQPTTIEGVIALLTYVADHEAAGAGFADLEDEEDGKVADFRYWINRHAADALAEIAPRAGVGEAQAA